ncbi:MAG: nucleotidyltransferase domain-containing protein [bacterium]
MLEDRFRKPNFLSLAEREKIVEKIKDYLSQKEKIVFASLYGSFVRDEPFRDIDIALLIKEPIQDCLGLESDLSYEMTSVTGYPAEVRIINKAPVALQMAVLRERKLLFSRDEEKRTDFIQDVGKRYIDYSHLREMAM